MAMNGSRAAVAATCVTASLRPTLTDTLIKQGNLIYMSINSRHTQSLDLTPGARTDYSLPCRKYAQRDIP
eukprot:4505317-Pleurochrysis_carterae.AAC.1